MPYTSWALWLLLSAAAFGVSLWWYRRRETRGRGRLLLAALRGAAISLLLLILFDPELTFAGGSAAAGTQVLLDASLSMSLPDDGSTRWARAVERARQQSGGRDILLFGDAVRPASLPLPDSAPGDAGSRLLPGVQAAAEAGARRVVVITDGGLEDGPAVMRWAARLGLGIEIETVGGDIANRALVEASAPRWAEAGEPATLEFGVGAAGEFEGDSVVVVARQADRVIGRVAVASPASGRVSTGAMEVRLDASGDGAPVRVDLSIEGSDGVPDDDTRVLYIDVGGEPGGIALVSFRPDWEPRFLAPVLEQALGLPLNAYLRGATGQYLRLGRGLQAGAQATEADVQAAVQRAELVVLHGFGAGAPGWAFEAAESAQRVLIFPADGAADALPIDVGAELEADFWPVPAVPASPIAPLLSGLQLEGLTPLAGLRAVVNGDSAAGWWTPLHVTRGRQGGPLPVAAAGMDRDRRWVVALGSGYWQWAFRGGAERQAYTRLWGALGGWLANEPGLASAAAVRPAQRVLPRGPIMPWVAPGMGADSIRIRVSGAAGSVVLDTVVTGAAADTSFTRAPAPGSYTYEAVAFGADQETAASGEFTVERYSPELMRGATATQPLAGDVQPVRGSGAVRARGTPLHTTPWPYLLLVLLLATEWVLRRRWGLR